MLLIKRFIGEKYKLKGFLIQIRIKVLYKGTKLAQVSNQVAYIGLFLIGRALEWFKPYLIEIQTNRVAIINLEVRYIFLSQVGFANKLIQIYGDLELVVIAKGKLYQLI